MTFRPLGSTPSGLRLSKCSDSYAVMCDTVVKTSAQCAELRSIQYLGFGMSHRSMKVRLDNVPVIDAALAGFMVDVKVL